MNYDFDAIIIGAGVVGLSIDMPYLKMVKILILEKNNKFLIKFI